MSNTKVVVKQKENTAKKPTRTPTPGEVFLFDGTPYMKLEGSVYSDSDQLLNCVDLRFGRPVIFRFPSDSTHEDMQFFKNVTLTVEGEKV